MRDEAKANEEADKESQERADKLNHADTVIFQTEAAQRARRRIPADKKASVESALERLKEKSTNGSLEGHRLSGKKP